jgi:hypothetical protein
MIEPSRGFGTFATKLNSLQFRDNPIASQVSHQLFS